MKKNLNIRNIIIVMLCITIILMGVGFAFLASKLEEANKQQDNFEVIITKVEAQTSIKGGSIDPTATKELMDEGKSVKFNFNLHNPKDELAYEITIKNTGNIPAKIIRLISSPDYIKDSRLKPSIEPIVITHTDLANKMLNPDETVTVKLLVSYTMTNNVKPINVPYQITVLATSRN